MNDNRVMILPIEWDLLDKVLRGRVKLNDLPADVEIVGVQNISLFRMVEFVVKSETFAPLLPGTMIPHLRPLLAADYRPTINPAEGINLAQAAI